MRRFIHGSHESVFTARSSIGRKPFAGTGKARRAAGGLDESVIEGPLDALFMEREIWADIPDALLDKAHDDALDDEILGYGPDGV